MKIAGIQKLTLLDFPGRCAATIFTPGCNLRCPFCHNASLVETGGQAVKADGSNAEGLVNEEELLLWLKGRFGRLTGLAVTGGEPLMQEDIAEFLLKVKALGYAIKLDTNGSYPDRLKKLIELNIPDYIAMDVKNSWKNYGKTVGIDAGSEVLIEKIKESMALLKSCGIDYEFRTTVSAQFHSAEDIEEIAKAVGPDSPFFIQCFKDSGDILRDGCSALSKDELLLFLEKAKVFAPKAQLRGVDL